MMNWVHGDRDEKIRAVMRANTYAYGIGKHLSGIDPRFKWGLYNPNGFSADLTIVDGADSVTIEECCRIYLSDRLLALWNDKKYVEYFEYLESVKIDALSGRTDKFETMQIVKVDNNHIVSDDEVKDVETESSFFFSNKNYCTYSQYFMREEGPAMLRELGDYIHKKYFGG